MIYPKKDKCLKCGGMMERMAGDTFYQYKYVCIRKSCYRNKEHLYGGGYDPEFIRLMNRFDEKRKLYYEEGIDVTGRDYINFRRYENGESKIKTKMIPTP